jgi:hypothetical protein
MAASQPQPYRDSGIVHFLRMIRWTNLGAILLLQVHFTTIMIMMLLLL